MDDARPDVPETRARRIGRWALAIFYAAAGVAHFLFTDAMVRIVPAWVPWDAREVVLTTGAAELICAAALMTRKWRLAAGWALALYALCVWPANVKHAMIDLAWLGGSGTGLFRATRFILSASDGAAAVPVVRQARPSPCGNRDG